MRRTHNRFAPRKVVDAVFKSSTQDSTSPNNKEKYMMTRQRITQFVLVALIAIIGLSFSTSSAYARGQCGGSVTSWKGYYNNLQEKGVVSQAAKVNQSAGYSPLDGSFKEWLQERVIVSRLAKSANVQNHGCNPGVLFGAGTKHLSKGWRVLVALPDKYSKDDISTKPKHGYKAERVKAKFVGQATCSNPGKKTVVVTIWVKKHRGPAKVTLKKQLQGGSYSGLFTFKVTMNGKTKTVKLKGGKKVSLGTVKRGTTVKVTETNIPSGWSILGSKTRVYKIKATRNIVVTNVKPPTEKPGQPAIVCISTNSGNLSGVGAVQGSCNDVTVICQYNSCNPVTENICPANASGGSANNGSTGGNANAEACKEETPEKPKPQCPPGTTGTYPNCQPPEKPKPTAVCTGLSVTPNPAVNLGVRSVVNYVTTGGATLKSVTISWGDGVTKTYNAATAEYIYARAGNYVVNATLTFSSSAGDLQSNCTATTVTPKDGTLGQGSGTPGPGGGPGAGGSPGSPTGTSTCRNDAGIIVYGTPDQFGYCPVGYVGTPV